MLLETAASIAMDSMSADLPREHLGTPPINPTPCSPWDQQRPPTSSVTRIWGWPHKHLTHSSFLQAHVRCPHWTILIVETREMDQNLMDQTKNSMETDRQAMLEDVLGPKESA